MRFAAGPDPAFAVHLGIEHAFLGDFDRFPHIVGAGAERVERDRPVLVGAAYRSEKAKRDAEKGILDVIVEVAGKALSNAADWIAGKIGSVFRGWW